MKIPSIKGIIPPMVTPLLDEDTLDVEGLEKLIEHLISGGVDGLFVLGTTGEGPSLSYTLRHELIQRVCDQVGERVPVLVGISDTSYRESIRITEKSGEYGADGVVLAPPYYFHMSRSELYNYMNRLIDEIALPLVLYNFPSLTKAVFDPEMVDELVRRPKVIALKDSSADAVYLHKINRVKSRSLFSLFTGPEELLTETLLMGGDGGVPGGANMFPHLYVDLYKAVNTGNIEKALILHGKIMQLSSVIYSGNGNSSGSIIAGIKKVLSYLNICSDSMSHSFKQTSTEKADRIKSFLASGDHYLRLSK